MDLQQIYDLVKENKNNKVTDIIFDTFDRLALDGKFQECDDIIKAIDIYKLNTFSIRSVLCITKAFKEKLPSRAEFFDKALVICRSLKGKNGEIMIKRVE